MQRSRVLPKFSVGAFTEDVGKGFEAKDRAEKEQKAAEERMGVERRKKREEETAFWTTPGVRTLVEPPILDWDWFFRVRIPSDLRFKMLVPNGPEKRCMAQDTHDDPDMDITRQEFYKNLLHDLYEDWQEVHTKYEDIFLMAPELSRFEFPNLDNDGRTTKLEKWIEKGADIFYEEGDEVREKYRHLVPADFVENRLATFEFCKLDLDGDTSFLEQRLRQGPDIWAEWPKEVQDKYGHLRRFLPAWHSYHTNGEKGNQYPSEESLSQHKTHDSGDRDDANQEPKRKTRHGLPFGRVRRFPGRIRVGYQPRGIERGMRIFRHQTKLIPGASVSDED